MADDRHECFANSSPETLKPTPYPTPFPTSPKNQPTNKPTRKRKKKKPTTAPTREPTNEPTPFPTPPPSPPPTKTTLQNLWYPDISTSRCVKNPEYTPPLVESFESYESCCSYAWIIYVDDCLDDAKENDVFYPDYFNGVCLNDGRQSPYENNVYSKAEDCCRNPNVDYSKCMLTFNKGGAPTRVYYPDYFFNVCRHDGKQSDSETNLFDNVEDCCSIDWMSAGSCIDNSD